MLTKAQLEAMPAETIFASGSFRDSIQEVNVHGTGQIFRWVACRGNIPDWAIYYGPGDWALPRLQKEGDKLFFERHIKRLVPCDDLAYALYRI